MKKQVLSFLMLGSLAGLAQAPAIQWKKSLGGTGTDDGNAVQQTADKGYIVAGRSNSTNGDVTNNKGTYDYWVTKLDSTGALTWQKTLGGSGDDEANAVIQTADGGYLVAGFSNSADSNITNPKGQYDLWLVKLGAAGNIKWQKSMGGTAYDYGWSIQQTTDKGYVIAGESHSNNYDLSSNNGNSDFWVLKTDSIGAIQWSKSYGGSGSESARSVVQTSDGGYMVGGQTSSNNVDVSANNGGIDYWVVKLSSLGALQWQKCLGGTADDMAYSIKQTSDGGYIAAGGANSNNGLVTLNHGSENAWIVKLTNTGTVSWEKCFGGDQFDGANAVQECSDGNFVFAGVASSNTIDVSGNNGGNDYWVVKISATGSLLWQKCLGGSGSDVANAMQITADNGYVVAGRASSSNGDITNAKGLDDFWVVKFVGATVTQTTNPSTGIAELNKNSNLLSVYPNPGNGLFTISADQSLLSSASYAQVLNSTGQRVYETEVKQTETSLDLTHLSDGGIYFLQLKSTSGAVVATKKIILN